MSNPLTKTRIEYHILQSFPVTCLNRDDVGAPKTAIVGGALRARVSSQAWKRPVRLALQDLGVKLAMRTKKVAQIIEKGCLEAGANEDKAKECGDIIAGYLTKDTLHFFTTREADAFVERAKELEFDIEKLKQKSMEKEIAKISKQALKPEIDGLDIALFGRMVAKAPELNIEAASSFAHAISTHKISNEVDFFTALDDEKDEQGSAHMGSLEFNSATYYRYISLDLGQLWTSLSGQSIDNAVASFTKALFEAIPTARQTTQSGASFWDYAKVLVRKGQRLQASFDKPVKAKGNGFLEPSIEHLKNELKAKEEMAGSMFGKIDEFEIGSGSDLTIDDLVDKLVSRVPNE